VSDWNLYLERVLSLRLNVSEFRLALAVARCTLGWNTRKNAVGQQHLRQLSGLHGRSFERARDNLVAAGLFAVERGRGGRGNRDTYRLLLGDEETPARERDFAGRAPELGGRPETPAKTPAETPAPQRARKEKGEREEQRQMRPAVNGSPREDDETNVLHLLDGDLNLLDAYSELVEALDNGDPTLLRTLVDQFTTEVTRKDIHDVHDYVIRRRERSGRGLDEPIENEAGYVWSALWDKACRRAARESAE
jgi:hypothetical protein